MAKQKNQRIYSNREHLETLAEDLDKYIGRPYRLDLNAGVLTIFARPLRHKKSKPEGKKDRNKREEKFERRA